MTTLAYSVNDALRLLGIGRTKFYTLVKNGAIPTRKLGKRTLVLAKDLEAFIDGLPAAPAAPNSGHSYFRMMVG